MTSRSRSLCRRKFRHGFTLIEMLVVVAIVAILAALLFTGTGRMIEMARTAKCMSNQRQIVASLILYAGDNHGQLPPYAMYPESPPYWIQSIAPYLNVPNGSYVGTDFLRCPSAPADGGSTIGVNYGYSPYGIFSYQAVGGNPTLDVSAAIVAGSRRLSHIPASTMLIGDRNSALGGIAINTPYLFGMNAATYNYFSPRHNGAAVCGFVDGSVRPVSLNDWLANTDNIWGPVDW